MTLAMATLVRRKPSGIWYFRKAVPEALQDAVGHDEILRSLRTTEIGEARRRHRAVADEVEAEWDRLRFALEIEGARAEQQPVRLISLSQKDAHGLAGEFYRELVAVHEADPGSAERWTQRLLAMTDALPLHQREPGAPNRIWNYSMQPNMVAARMFSQEVRSFLERRGLAVDTLGFRLLSGAVALAMRDAAAHLKRNALGDYAPDPKALRFPPVPAIAQRGSKGGAVGVERFLELWYASTHVSTARRQAWSGKLRNLMKHAEKDDVAAITVDDVVAWRNARKLSGISARTISEGDLSGVRALFNWAIGEAELPSITTNPVAGVKMAFKAPKKTRLKGFTFKEADKILRATFDPVEGFTEAGAGARRWVPWLCAFSGARVGEIGQIHESNIVEEETPSGFKAWCMRLTPEDGTMKNDEYRVVPLHPQVLEQGFLDYVRERRGKPLFYEPELARKKDTHHRQADKVGERLAKWIRKLGITGPVQPNHGWRHRFESTGRTLRVRKDIVDHITGHVESDVAATYGEYLVEALYLAIQCFPRYLDKEPNLVAQAAAPQQDKKVLGISIFAMPQED
jgi:integrase